jgi:hypothetical protein
MDKYLPNAERIADVIDCRPVPKWSRRHQSDGSAQVFDDLGQLLQLGAIYAV